MRAAAAPRYYLLVIDGKGRSSRYLYRQLAANLRAQIRHGVFPIGTRLPSVRTLARLHHLNPSTVTEAFLLLEREGFVEARLRSGFYATSPPGRAVPTTVDTGRAPVQVDVSNLVAEVLRANDERLVPLGLSTLGPALLPTARLNRALRRAIGRRPAHSASYGSPTGVSELRQEIARLLIYSGVTCSPDEIIITAGGMETLHLALRTVAAPGDVVAVESPTYFGILQAVESNGLKAVEVPSDPRSGIDLDRLEHAIRRHRAKAAIVMTTCHNPLGSVMSDAAKQALVGLVTDCRIALIEDDVYGELAHTAERPRAAKAFDRAGHVMLCSSASKTLAPGLRVGWLAPGRYQLNSELVKSVTSRITSALPQLGLAELLATGFYPRYIRRVRRQLTAQISDYASAIHAHFPVGTRVTQPSGGTVLWVQLPDGSDGTMLYRRALENGISIMPGEVFSLRRRHAQFIRISCAHPWSPRIAHGMTELAQLARRLAR